MIIAGIAIFLFLLYAILIVYYFIGWKRCPEFIPTDGEPETSISVIIPARNEAAHIGPLLQSLQVQNYPSALTEIIVVDDFSDDATAEIVRSFSNVKLVKPEGNENESHKKKALDKGISIASGTLIVTTDADCIVAPEWLKTIEAAHRQKKYKFIAAPVKYLAGDSILDVFQSMDFIVLQGITAAAVNQGVHSMCNGANLAFEKKAFLDVGGYSGIDHIASGDDMLLMHKIGEKFPGSTGYLKSSNAIVLTKPAESWRAFIRQRLRWSSKTLHYRDRRIFAALLLVLLFNILFPLLAIAGFFNSIYWLIAIILLVLKTAVELPFFIAVAGFYKSRSLASGFFFMQPLHIAYTVFVGIAGQLPNYQWKGRKLR